MSPVRRWRVTAKTGQKSLNIRLRTADIITYYRDKSIDILIIVFSRRVRYEFFGDNNISSL